VPSLVVDASVAIKWFNPAEDLADRANLIRDDYVHGRIALGDLGHASGTK
jgi:hypothetical protein